MEARDWAPLLADVPERVRDRTVSRSANTSVMGPDLSTLHHPHGGVAAGPRQTSPPEAVDTEMRREPSPFEADSDSPGGRLGTWAGRQRVFAEFLRGEEAEEAGRAAARAAAAAADGSDDEEEGEGGERVSPRTSASPPEVQGVRPRHIFGPALLGGEERAASSGPVVLGAMRAPASNAGGRGADSAAAAQRSAEDEDVNMAWRWRFTRKWQVCVWRVLGVGGKHEHQREGEEDGLAPGGGHQCPLAHPVGRSGWSPRPLLTRRPAQPPPPAPPRHPSDGAGQAV